MVVVTKLSYSFIGHILKQLEQKSYIILKTVFGSQKKNHKLSSKIINEQSRSKLSFDGD